MAHPYKDKACGGAATAKHRYARGGEIERESLTGNAKIPDFSGKRGKDSASANQIMDTISERDAPADWRRKSGGKVK